MNLKSLCSGLLSLALAASASAQEPWTLEQCIAHAHSNNLTVKQQQLAADLAQEAESQARYASLPNLNGFASHRYTNGRTQADFTFAFSDNWNRSNSFGLNSNVTLFNGLQTYNTYQQAKIDRERTELDVEATKDNISLAIAGSYLQVIFAQELVGVAEEQVRITQQQVDRVEKLVSAGGAAKNQLLDIKAQLASEELAITNAENTLRLAYLNLKQLLDLEADADFEIVVPEVGMADNVEHDNTPGQVYNAANMRMPVVKSAELQRQSAERNLSLAKGLRSPVLQLGYSMGSGYSSAINQFVEEPITFGQQMEDNFNQSIGLSLSVPIFNRFGTNIAINRARISVLQADYQLQQVRLNLRKDVEQAYNDAAAALKKYQATQKSVEALEESFKYTRQRFEVGVVTALDFNQAKNNLLRAQSELLQAKFDYLFKNKVLDFYQGRPLSL